jgi:hypothetical protein
MEAMKQSGILSTFQAKSFCGKLCRERGRRIGRGVDAADRRTVGGIEPARGCVEDQLHVLEGDSRADAQAAISTVGAVAGSKRWSRERFGLWCRFHLVVGDDAAVDDVDVREKRVQQVKLVHASARADWGRAYEQQCQQKNNEISGQHVVFASAGLLPVCDKRTRAARNIAA